MKILCCGDQHWTTKKPKNRTDDYYRTVLDKLQQELEIAEEHSCKAIIFPGDLFDSFKENHAIIQDLINLFKKSDTSLMKFCVAGQHDQQFHNPDLRGTALGTLLAANSVMLVGKEPVYPTNGVAIYGASWKDEIPEITTPDRINILVTHRMIVDEKLWAQQEGHEWANHILRKTEFDLIVSGDNHLQFTATYGQRHLLNMGSMLRSNIGQVNHHPAVGVYDTNTRSVELMDLVIAPMNEVMCVEKAEKEKERNANLDSFVKSLQKDEEFGPNGEVRVKLDFMDALEDYITRNDVPEEVSDIIYDCAKS